MSTVSASAFYALAVCLERLILLVALVFFFVSPVEGRSPYFSFSPPHPTPMPACVPPSPVLASPRACPSDGLFNARIRLTKLHFQGGFPAGFLDDAAFPPSLKDLCLGDGFNEGVQGVRWPPGLEKVKGPR